MSNTGYGIAWHTQPEAIGASPEDIYLWRETGLSFGATKFAVIDTTGTRSDFDDLTIHPSLEHFEHETRSDRHLFFESLEWFQTGTVLEPITAETDWMVFGPMSGFNPELETGRRWATVPQRPNASTHSVAVMAHAAATRYRKDN